MIASTVDRMIPVAHQLCPVLNRCLTVWMKPRGQPGTWAVKKTFLVRTGRSLVGSFFLCPGKVASLPPVSAPSTARIGWGHHHHRAMTGPREKPRNGEVGGDQDSGNRGEPHAKLSQRTEGFGYSLNSETRGDTHKKTLHDVMDSLRSKIEFLSSKRSILST